MINNQELKYPSIRTILTEKDGVNTLSISPLLPGFGHTLGNSLRRVFLSSIPGFSVTRIRINDITHEYQAIEGIVEDAMDVILNLKGLKVKITGKEEKVTLVLEKSSEGQVTANDFSKDSAVEVINPELEICYLNKGADLSIEVDVERGFGYQPVYSKEMAKVTNPQDILVDRVFSPVDNVKFQVNHVRVGDDTNFDKIDLSFTTNSTVSADEIVKYALKTLSDLNNNIFLAYGSTESLEEVKTVLSSSEADAIDLPPRITKILEANDILTNSQLKARIKEVPEFAGVGGKAIEAINEYVGGMV